MKKLNSDHKKLIRSFVALTAAMSSAAFSAFYLSGQANAMLYLLSAVLLLVCLITGIIRFFRNMRVVMKSGSIWKMINLKSDLLYYAIIMAFLLMTSFSFLLPPGLLQTLCAAFFLLALSVSWGMLAVRKYRNRVFLFFTDRERKIIECMQDSVTEMSGKQYDSLYDEIYQRLSGYFEQEQPYLNETLTINDVAREIYTNKVYVSRAISKVTGKNFCQFVNSFRIRYAIEEFYRNPDLRVSDLSCMSGFHNVVSFNMAFHMNMNQPPSEWCRITRNKIRKPKK